MSAPRSASYTDPASYACLFATVHPAFIQNLRSRDLGLSDEYITLLWYGLAERTRNTYNSGTRSWERFCTLEGCAPYPAQAHQLGEWIARRVITGGKEGVVAGATASGYLAGVRSKHIDLGYPIEAFSDHMLRRAMQGALNLRPPKRKPRLPITIDVLSRITATPPTSATGYNLDALFKVAYAGFFRLGELTYTRRDTEHPLFRHTHVLRGDVSFIRDDRGSAIGATVFLRHSKTDYQNQGVTVYIAATSRPTCAVAALLALFKHDEKPLNAPLFDIGNGHCSAVVVQTELRQRLRALGLISSEDDKSYTGHSFRRGAATDASNKGVPEHQFMLMGRWTSDAFKRYISHTEEQRLGISRRILTS
jgi:predicted aconitase with swiveling domain